MIIFIVYFNVLDLFVDDYLVIGLVICFVKEDGEVF